MCGIAGIIGNISPDKLSWSLARMMDAQAHRGPDDQGLRVISTQNGQVGLGHRRLAILDLSPLGHQPMENPETGDLIVYNGEIYNFKVLRDVLQGRGIAFHSDSDTELILRAYEVWGRDCLERFRGMFAFALWDSRRQCLLLARDHLGIKPLYYTTAQNSLLLFASEVRALVVSGLIPHTIDRRALAGYLAYGSIQAPLTVLENVRSLDAANWMEIDALGQVIGVQRYWQIPPPDRSSINSSRNLSEEARQLLSTSISRHLVSDVPIGVFLSGGLDSTTIAGLMSGIAPATTRSFTVSFADVPDENEGDIAAETSRKFNIGHCDCPVSAGTVLKWVQKALEVMDQPSMDGLNTYIVSRAVREQGIIVALSGQGGDEMFGGYPSFREVPALHRMLRWTKFIPSDLRVMAAHGATYGKNEAYRKKAVDMARSGPNLLDLYFHRRRACADSQMAALGLEAEELSLTRNFQVPEADGSDCLVPDDPVASIGRLETKYYLSNTLLRDGDVYGMANSLEIRVPMLDRDVAEWIFKLPGDMILPANQPSKYLLRKACSDLYSEAVIKQRKRGFVVPLFKWMNGPLQDVVFVGIDCLKKSGLVKRKGINGLIEDFGRNPESPIWSRVWTLVVLGHWLQNLSASSKICV